MIDDDLADDLSVERFDRRDRQVAKVFGHEETARGRALRDRCLGRLTDAIKAYGSYRHAPETALAAAFRAAGHPCGGQRGALWSVLKRVDPEQIALAILSGALRVIGVGGDVFDGEDDRETTLRVTCEHIGRNLQLACRSARLLRKDATGYWKIDWDDDRLHGSGGWGVDMLLEALPSMFELLELPVEGGK